MGEGALDGRRRGFYPEIMDALIVAALVGPVLYLAVPPALAAWRRYREGKPVLAWRPKKKPALVIPAAGETAAAIERFHRALLRTDLADFLKPDSNNRA